VLGQDSADAVEDARGAVAGGRARRAVWLTKNGVCPSLERIRWKKPEHEVVVALAHRRMVQLGK
jgi:hypothetical protein